MQIFDKLADNQTLSPAEMSELKRFGRDIQTINIQADLLRGILSDIDILYSSDTDPDYNFNVPEHYRHLVIIGQARSVNSLPANSVYGYGLKINGDGSGSYTYKYVQASDYTGGNPYSSVEHSISYMHLGSVPPSSSPSSNTSGIFVSFLPNILGAVHKTAFTLSYVVIEKEVLYLLTSRWASTSAIRSISVRTPGGLAPGSFISVYGLR